MLLRSDSRALAAQTLGLLFGTAVRGRINQSSGSSWCKFKSCCDKGELASFSWEELQTFQAELFSQTDPLLCAESD